MDKNNYHDLSDEELVQLCKVCDDKALTVLIERLGSVVGNCVDKFSDSRFEREDLVQEGLVASFRAILSYDSSKGASLRTYAGVCITNALKNFVRKKDNGLITADADFVPLVDETAGDTTAEDEYISSENYKNLRRSLEEILTVTEYRVFSLFAEGLSYSEISLKTGQSFKSVDTAMQRVRKKLRNIL